MKLVILAAGEGVRMRPLTYTVPKPLLCYRNKTALDHLFDALPDAIDEVSIIVQYLHEHIRSYCGSVFHGKTIHYIEGEKTGNALGFMKSRKFIDDGERFAVAYADDVLTKKEVLDCLSYEFSWLYYIIANPKNVGVLEVDQHNIVSNLIEKPENPTSNLVADGFMVVNSDIFAYTPMLHPNGEYYFSDLMAQFCKDHKVVAVAGDPKHSQLTSPQDIERLNTLP